MWKAAHVQDWLAKTKIIDSHPVFILSKDGSEAAKTGCLVRPAQLSAWLNAWLNSYTIRGRHMGGRLIYVRLRGSAQTFISVGEHYTAYNLGVSVPTLRSILRGESLNSVTMRGFIAHYAAFTPPDWPHLSMKQINQIMQHTNYK